MLTKLTIRNFKQFDEVEIPLDNGVVFVGPNNSGKTSALQALALWHAGLQAWADKRLIDSGAGVKIPKKRPGVTINRRELLAVPIDRVDMLWRNLRVRSGSNVNVRIDLIVEGQSPQGENWKCGLEFDYASRDAVHCRPMRLDEAGDERMLVPDAAVNVKAALLPPMSGLAADEAQLQPGKIDVLLGEGQTAQVLRNICYRISSESKEQWDSIVSRIDDLFSVQILDPERLVRRGEIQMHYTERGRDGIKFGLASSGRGMLQVLLLLAFLNANQEGTTLLVDEPDAHLEILRQQSIYRTLSDAATERGSQVIAASHSEALLREAAARNAVVTFVGKPHLLSRGGNKHMTSALSTIDHNQYYLAESRGWVLYLEDKTDLDILFAFAEKIGHGVLRDLREPFLYKIKGDTPARALSKHFDALRAAKPDLVAALLVDSDKEVAKQERPESMRMKWARREIENYICSPRGLIAFAGSNALNGVWGHVEPDRRREAMKQEIEKLKSACKIAHRPPPFSHDVKVSDETLKPLFTNFAKAIDVQPPLRKGDFYKIVPFIPDNEVDPEIQQKLDTIHEVVKKAKPRTN